MKINVNKVTLREKFKKYPIVKSGYIYEEISGCKDGQLMVYLPVMGGYYPMIIRINSGENVRLTFIRMENFRTYENCCKYLSEYENRCR